MTIRISRQVISNPGNNSSSGMSVSIGTAPAGRQSPNSRQSEFNTGTTSARLFGALSANPSDQSLQLAQRNYVPNSQTDDATAQLTTAIQSL